MHNQPTTLRKQFENIANNSSRLAKEAMLEEYGHDAIFVKALQFLYNPLITTGISEKKLARMVKKSNVADIDTESRSSEATITELMDYLEQNSTGRDADLFVVADYIANNELDKEDTAFIEKLVSKNLKVGITSKTINKVFTGDNGEPFVYEFSPMLAADFAKRADKITGDFYVTQKLDGIRCLAFKSVNDLGEISVDLFARSGKEIVGQHHIRKQIAENTLIPVDTVLDGELLISDTSGLEVGEMFRETQKIVRNETGDRDNEIVFWVFDAVSLEEFKRGVSDSAYTKRREQISGWFNANADNECIRLLPVLYKGSDKAEITRLADEMDNRGYEGVMVNTADGLYHNKRVDALQKVKSFKSADLVCTGVIEGKGRHVGTLGAVIVEYKNNRVQVGSGFDDAERDQYWADNDSIVGKIVEVKYFEETTDSSTGLPSLRFPVFVGVRDDKTESDVNYG